MPKYTMEENMESYFLWLSYDQVETLRGILAEWLDTNPNEDLQYIYELLVEEEN
jgi:hypothetical protein